MIQTIQLILEASTLYFNPIGGIIFYLVILLYNKTKVVKSIQYELIASHLSIPINS